MSSAHDAHGASAHAHDDHDAFDGEPAKELSPGEPRSPAWLPAVGLAFFSCVAVYLLAGGDPENGNNAPAPKPMAVEVHAQPQAVAPAPMPAPRPEAAPAGSARRLSPEQLEAVKKRIDEARAKAGPAGH
jgi:hypothetical protein